MKWRTNSEIHKWLPRLQAHRGYWVQGLQQNSLKSIVKAYELKYEMAEFDVRLTKDQVVVLFHDEQYQGQKLDQMNFSELKEKTKKEFPHISTLEEVLIWLKKSGAGFKLNIEIKSKTIFDKRLEIRVNHLIQKYSTTELVLISSFNPFSLYRFRKMSPKIYRALLLTNDEGSNFILNRMWLNFLCLPDVLHLRYVDFDLQKYSDVEVPIVLWTVNALSEIQDFQKVIYGVISDRITPDSFFN